MQQPMNSEERVWTTFNHQEPDRIPLYEGVIEPAELNRTKKMVHQDPGLLFFLSPSLMKIMTATWARPIVKIFLKAIDHPQIMYPFVKPGLFGYSRLHRGYGMDLISFIGGIPMVFNPRIFEEFGAKGNRIYGPGGRIIMDVPPGGGSVARSGFLRDEADYEKYMQFDPDHPVNHVMVRNAVKAAKGKFALVFTVFGAAYFEYMCEMFGMETLFRLMIKSPNFIDRVVKDMSAYARAVLEIQAEMGVKIVYMTDDLGQTGRPLISPRMYNRFFHAGIKKFCETAHRHDIKVMRHSDGNITDLIPFFLEEGIDALHPWESDAGMDIFKGKQQWGTKLTLFGNVPIEMLSHSTPHEIVGYVKRLCAECGPGGGYILASSHSIVYSIQWQNYLAMLWAAKKFGQYHH